MTDQSNFDQHHPNFNVFAASFRKALHQLELESTPPTPISKPTQPTYNIPSENQSNGTTSTTRRRDQPF